MILRSTWLEVDLSAIEHNAKVLHEMAGVPVMAVVKADAYGHGLLPVAKAALRGGASALAVAIVEEGLALREAGITAPILVLGISADPAIETAIRNDLILCLSEERQAAVIGAAAKRLQLPARVHLKLDTGMGRIGLRSPEEAAGCLAACRAAGFEPEGVFTHLATADVLDEEGRAYVFEQQARLAAMLQALCTAGFAGIVHAAASAASILFPSLRCDMVREGIALYGTDISGTLDLRPALCWKTHILYLKTIDAGETVSYGRYFTAQRPTRVATLPVGYADGYRRSMRGKAQVLLGGRRMPVIGTICMDQILVDVTDAENPAVGDEVVLLGPQGGDILRDTELAQWADTINYEIMTGITKRVPREYLHG